jgi:hypothetical protein
MSLYLEGSIECERGSELEEKLKAVLERGSFGYQVEHPMRGEVAFEFRKELLTIENSDVLDILEAFSKPYESDILNFLKRY